MTAFSNPVPLFIKKNVLFSSYHVFLCCVSAVWHVYRDGCDGRADRYRSPRARSHHVHGALHASLRLIANEV